MKQIFAIWDKKNKEIIPIGFSTKNKKNPFFFDKNEANEIIKTAKSNKDTRDLCVVAFNIDIDNPIFC